MSPISVSRRSSGVTAKLAIVLAAVGLILSLTGGPAHANPDRPPLLRILQIQCETVLIEGDLDRQAVKMNVGEDNLANAITVPIGEQFSVEGGVEVYFYESIDGGPYELTFSTTYLVCADPTPTEEPTTTPTEEPTTTPTEEPTGTPTGEPTGTPTGTPTGEPTGTPTEEPTTAPTREPTPTPTKTTSPGGPDASNFTGILVATCSAVSASVENRSGFDFRATIQTRSGNASWLAVGNGVEVATETTEKFVTSVEDLESQVKLVVFTEGDSNDDLVIDGPVALADLLPDDCNPTTPPTTLVVPVDPLLGVPACSDFELPDTEGVDYAVTSSQDGYILTVTVTATPQEGFWFEGKQVVVFSHDFDTSKCGAPPTQGGNGDGDGGETTKPKPTTPPSQGGAKTTPDTHKVPGKVSTDGGMNIPLVALGLLGLLLVGVAAMLSPRRGEH